MFSLFRRGKQESSPLAKGVPVFAPDLSPTALGLPAGSMDESLFLTPGAVGAYRANIPLPPPRPLWKALTTGVDTYLLRKSVEQNYWQSVAKSQQAALQGTVVNPALDYWGGYDASNARDKTGTTFGACRLMAQSNEVIAAIIGKRVAQVTAYARRAVVRRGVTTDPGFRIKVADPAERATPEDKKKIAELEMYFEECGYVEPPEAERPLSWQPGFDMFLSQVTRDTLTLDHVAVRRWFATENPDKYPVVAFACLDAAKIQYAGRELKNVKDGVPVWAEPSDRQRGNTPDRIAFKKVSDGGSTLEEYTARELFCTHRRARTDEYANGYGFSEIEEAWICSTLFCASRDFNGMRFSKNSLPRGMWVVFGNMNPQQFSAFQLSLRQQMTGLKNQMNIPVVSGTPQAGSSVQFVPVDPNPKDLEHSQSIFTYGSWIHSLYQISPDETGFSGTSPFRPPLSEASPETNLKYSQDAGLRPLLRWIENFLNREILWKIEPSRRYKFEFVGVGDYDEMADIQVRTARLSAGLSTPEMEWNELDITMPDEIAKHPAAKFPAPFSVGMQMLQSMGQSEQATQQEQAQQEQAQQAQQHGQDMDKLRLGMGGQGGQGAEQGEGQPPEVSGAPETSGASAPPPGIGNPVSPMGKAVTLTPGAWPF